MGMLDFDVSDFDVYEFLLTFPSTAGDVVQACEGFRLLLRM